jgi:Flp pilus assembly protein TadG
MNSAKSIRQQQGTVLVLTALCLFVLMGAAGLAIDLGHTLVNKTIEQNAADAMALSAAIRLNQQNDSTTSTDEQAAATFGLETYDLFKQSPGNAEINSGLANNTFTFTFTTTNDLSSSPAWQTAPPAVDANFVRVTSAAMPVNAWFAGVVGFPQLAVSSSAVAGFIPIQPCNLSPIMVCVPNPHPSSCVNLPAGASDSDKDFCDCSDGDCYGYTINNIYCLTPAIGGGSGFKCQASENTSWGSGNIGFIDLGSIFPGVNQGAQTLGQCLAKSSECPTSIDNYCASGVDLTQIPGKTGVNLGPVETGIESLFNATNNSQYAGNSDTITGLPINATLASNATYNSSDLSYLDWDEIAAFTTPVVTQIPISGLPLATLTSNGVPSPYAVYDSMKSLSDNIVPGPGKYRQRIFNIPFVDCTNPPNGSSGTNPMVGFGCFLLTAKAQKSGSEVFILGQFITDQSICQSTGTTTSTGEFGFDKVIEYKDPLGGHS